MVTLSQQSFSALLVTLGFDKILSFDQFVRDLLKDSGFPYILRDQEIQLVSIDIIVSQNVS